MAQNNADYPAADYRKGGLLPSASTGRCSQGSAALALLLCLLLGLSGFFGFAALSRSAPLRTIVRVRLFVIVAARPAKEEQNFLSVLKCGQTRCALFLLEPRVVGGDTSKPR
jgi:hypothetical protein